ncbi:MAG: hypothetical protein IJX44_05965 [Bacteroidaceae bacterium]|nr:hypothetical protein [Bacteroidaceae bacterium]
MKKLLIMLCSLFGFASLNAQTQLAGSAAEAPVMLMIGEEYLFPTDFSIAIFAYTAEKDGVLTLEMSSPLRIFRTDAQGNSFDPLPLFGTDCMIGVQAGETYYFQHATTWGKTITLKVAFVEGAPYLPIVLEQVTPADGSVYHTTTKEGSVSFEFNVAVNTSNLVPALVLSDGEQVSLTDYTIAENYTTQGTIYTLQVAATYNSLLAVGKLKPGDTFSIVLTNVADKAYPENCFAEGISVCYTASPEAVTLTDVNKQGTLKSYYMEGDEEGLVVLTFSDDVMCSAESALLTYGDREAGTWVELPVPYTIQGNTIVWNMQGIHMNKAPLDDEGRRIVNVSLRGICDTSGNYIEGNTKGSAGTIHFSYAVETIDVNVYCDFMPAIGSNIDAVEEIEIWIAEGVYVAFDSVKISFIKDGETVELLLPKDSLRIEADPYNAKDLLVYVPLSGCVSDAGEITVELTGVMTASGSVPVIRGTFVSSGKGSSAVLRHNVSAFEKPLEVYDLQGRLLRILSIGEGVEVLPSGIYLIDGKRIIVHQ